MRRGPVLTLLCLLACGTAWAQDATPTPTPTLTLSEGALRGTREADGSLVFRAIPYAAPPVDGLRWQAPQPVAPWQGERDATGAAPACAQPALGWNDGIAASSREDCLYVEVQTPTLTPTAPLPVMVWLHGGANVAGGAAGYVPSALAAEGVVLVTVQYRLGVFGFLALPELRDARGHAAANFALQDQIAALRWVREHIARFGGDPARVTLFGQSAGAQDVGLLMVAPAARGLFSAALAQSGTAAFGMPARPLAEHQRLGGVIAQRAGVAPGRGRLAALRVLPAATLIAAAQGVEVSALDDSGYIWLQPVADGTVLPETPQAALARGAQAPVPLLIGSNARELTFGDGEATARARLRRDHADVAERVLAAGAAHTPPAYGDAAMWLATDLGFRCPALYVAGRQAARGVPVWHYEFDLAAPGAQVAHSAELPFVFQALPVAQGEAKPVTLTRYWANFARTGDPNGDGLPPWPAYSPGRESLRFSAEGVTTVRNLRGGACDALRWP